MKDKNDILNGIIEMDKTYIGGSQFNKHKNKKIIGKDGKGIQSQ